MRRILQIDGGGIRGIIPATILAHLETQLCKPLAQCFDLITGTSTGAIIGGAIAAGVPAQEIANIYLDKGKHLFTRRSRLNPRNWVCSKYDRNRFLAALNQTQGRHKTTEQRLSLKHIHLADLHTRFMATAFNLVSQRTHFIKSWHERDSQLPLIEVIAWSALSALHYFDRIAVADYQWTHYRPNNLDPSIQNAQGAIFQDGGQGAHNNTLGYILVQILAEGWTQEDEIYILSLGTGHVDPAISYAQANKLSCLKQLLLYLRDALFYGGQARKESIMDQVLATRYVSGVHPKMHFKRIDQEISKRENQLDSVHYIKKFEDYGHALCENIEPIDLEILRR